VGDRPWELDAIMLSLGFGVAMGVYVAGRGKGQDERAVQAEASQWCHQNGPCGMRLTAVFFLEGSSIHLLSLALFSFTTAF
jgi:hypothetical protein